MLYPWPLVFLQIVNNIDSDLAPSAAISMPSAHPPSLVEQPCVRASSEWCQRTRSGRVVKPHVHLKDFIRS